MSLTLLAAAAGFYFLPHGRDIPTSEPLAKLPLTIGQWHGVDVPLDPAAVKTLGVDEYVNRTYEDEERQPIGLYIGYYKSQRTDETLHSPQNCLPGSGWQPLSAQRVGLTALDGQTAEVNRYLIQKGLERQIVLYWYQSHGRTIASEYTAKIDMVVDAVRLHRTDAALVRINTPIASSGIDDRATKFATIILGALDEFIPK